MYLVSKFDVSGFSVTGDIYIDFQTSHFADFEQFKVDIYIANFGQVKIDSIRSFLLTLDRSVILLSLDKTCFKDGLIKIQEPHA